MTALSETGRQIVNAAAALPPEEQKEVIHQVQRLNKDLWTTGDAHRTRLWLTLLGGLFAIAIVAIICGVYLAAKGEDATALVAIASAVVAGVIGLFANPPTAD